MISSRWRYSGTANSGSLTFAAGETYQTITFAVVGDTEEEADETLQVALSDPSYATIDVATATGTILNDDEEIIGTAAADKITPDVVSIGVQGGPPDDTADIIKGLAGNDELDGGAGNDTLNGGLGADDLSGGDGFDVGDYSDATVGVSVNLKTPAENTGEAVGDKYNSVEGLLGSAFDDFLTGKSNDNWLSGGKGDDDLLGLAGNYTLEGGNGRDTLEGGAGNDLLKGWAGNDRLEGGAGNDTLKGGADADTFVFSADADQINDFGTGDDNIDLTMAVGITDYTDLQTNHLSENGGNTIITDDAGSTLIVLDVELTSLNESDFTFI